ncbi:MAG: putative capsular polysaccharide synthesis family protein, partial [Pseudomonadales bacterium]
VDRCAPTAFREFLNMNDFQIVKQNEAKAKKYYQLYKKFKTEAVFPRRYIDAVYGSKYARHFYTDAELAGFRQRLHVSE